MIVYLAPSSLEMDFDLFLACVFEQCAEQVWGSIDHNSILGDKQFSVGKMVGPESRVVR